jgi:hypothetical protein
MKTDETPGDDSPATGTDSTHGCRRFVQLSSAAVAVGLAGCSSLGIGDDAEDTEPPDDAPGSTPVNQGNETGEPTATESGANGTEDGTATETETDVHEHGTLYLEIEGERQPFTDPKYYQPGEHEDAAASDRFHFHDDGNDYGWHMHGQRLTLAAALGELPDIEYESADGAHVVHYEGETYEDGAGASVAIRRGEEAIDPRAYELQDGDEIWIEITTGDGS